MTALAAFYPWLKVLHILSVVAWMAGLLYLPRLFVYHAGVAPGSEASETFKLMERRLSRAIMLPAMIATWLFGGLLAFTPGVVDWTEGWFHAKLALVVVLTVFQHLLGRWRLELAADKRPHKARFYRFANEVPALLLIFIVILVVVKPF
jgi:putative membrane protein